MDFKLLKIEENKKHKFSDKKQQRQINSYGSMREPCKLNNYLGQKIPTGPLMDH